MTFKHRKRSLTTEQRFWKYVEKTKECWNWIGAKGWDSYGVFYIGLASLGTRKLVRPHRFSYELLKGEIPDGLALDHLCRNRGCVNPDHLEPVTSKENILRGESPAAKNARKTHCKWGHVFDGENTGIYDGHRYCRTCRNNCSRRYKQRKKASSQEVSERT